MCKIRLPLWKENNIMRRQFYWLPLRGLIFATFALGLSAALHADPLRIVKIEPTAMFPKVKAGEPLRQLARLSLENSGAETEVNVKIIKEAGKKQWPYDALISQDGTDFQLITLDNADKIRHWNAKWAYQRLICATMDMFFDAIAAQADPAKFKAFAKDGNNQWADQDSAAARVLAEARKQGEAIPTAEKNSPPSPRRWPAENIPGPTSIRPTTAYGHTPIDRRLKEFDHIMYRDDTVEANAAYCYRVRAVNASGRKGSFSEEAQINTKDDAPLIALGRRITAQSVYAPEYGKVFSDRRQHGFVSGIEKGSRCHFHACTVSLEFKEGNRLTYCPASIYNKPLYGGPLLFYLLSKRSPRWYDGLRQTIIL